MADQIIQKIRSESPFPWRTLTFPNGLVQVVDSTGREVPIFHLTEYACRVSQAMATKEQA